MKNRIAQAKQVTWIGCIINIVLMVLKFTTGIIGESSALIADAFHSLSDFVTDIIILLGFGIISKPVDKSHDYGHGKVEALVTSGVGVGLFFVGISILYKSGILIFKMTQGVISHQPGLIAFYAAVVSLIVKEWLYRFTKRSAEKIVSQAILANAWHHRSDAFTSGATILGIGGAIVLGEKWRILDPAAAAVVSLFIIKTAINILRSSVGELIDASLSEEIENKILSIVKSVPQVKNPHNMKTRKLGNAVAIDIHIEVDKSLNITEAHNAATEVERKLKKTFGKNTFVSVHIEPSK